jgi:hypothetical protein
MTKQELKKLIKETMSEMAIEADEPSGLKGATVVRIMEKGGKVYIQLAGEVDGDIRMFDAVLV